MISGCIDRTHWGSVYGIDHISGLQLSTAFQIAGRARCHYQTIAIAQFREHRSQFFVDGHHQDTKLLNQVILGVTMSAKRSGSSTVSITGTSMFSSWLPRKMLRVSFSRMGDRKM